MSLSEEDRQFAQDLKKLPPIIIAKLLCEPSEYDCSTCPVNTGATTTLPCGDINCSLIDTDEQMISSVVVDYFRTIRYMSDEDALKRFRDFNQETLSKCIDALIAEQDVRHKKFEEWHERFNRDWDDDRRREDWDRMRNNEW